MEFSRKITLKNLMSSNKVVFNKIRPENTKQFHNVFKCHIFFCHYFNYAGFFYFQIFLVCPSSIKFQAQLWSKSMLEKSFFPHVTVEDFPLDDIRWYFGKRKLQTQNLLEFLKETFSMNIYKISTE